MALTPKSARIFWWEVLLTQADCSSRDSRLSLLSAYCLCVWRCRQRLYATAGDSRVLPAVHWLSRSTKKIKRRKIKTMRFLAPKN